MFFSSYVCPEGFPNPRNVFGLWPVLEKSIAGFSREQGHPLAIRQYEAYSSDFHLLTLAITNGHRGSLPLFF